MKYLSVCSGIEAATVAWHPMGWTPLGYAEIDKFPSAVLAHHYPHVPNLGDITKYKEWPDADPDVLVGGTPCQSFSVAGLRQGLADPRGNLCLTFLGIADRYRPEWILWENVPGVLSSDGGRDFGAFLGGLGQLGYGWCYRVLDAQYVRVDGFGRAVPQRRRRVFVVGNLRDWRRAAAVLFERESLCWNTPPRRQARQEVAGAIGAGSQRSGGRLGRREAAANHIIPATAHSLAAARGKAAANAADLETYLPVVADPISANEAGTYTHEGRGNFRLHNCITQPVANPLTARMHKGVNTTMDEGQTMVAHSLRADGFDASEDGTGRGTPLVPVAFSCKDYGADAGETAPTLRAMNFDGSHANAGGQVAIAFDTTQITNPNNRSQPQPDAPCHGPSANAHPPALAFQPRFARNGRGAPDEIASALTSEAGRTGKGDSAQCVATQWAVRRLTPVECERLQGFPNGYTNIPWRKRNGSPDGPRYKALGNSMAVNAMRWIGRRIQMVDDIVKEKEIET